MVVLRLLLALVLPYFALLCLALSHPGPSFCQEEDILLVQILRLRSLRWVEDGWGVFVFGGYPFS